MIIFSVILKETSLRVVPELPSRVCQSFAELRFLENVYFSSRTEDSIANKSKCKLDFNMGGGRGHICKHIHMYI